MAEYEFQVGDEVAWDEQQNRFATERSRREWHEIRGKVVHVNPSSVYVTFSVDGEDWGWAVETPSLRLIRKRGESEGPKVGETWVTGNGKGGEAVYRISAIADTGFAFLGDDGGAYPVGANVAPGFRRLLRPSPSPPVEASTERPKVAVRTEYERYTINVNDPFAVNCGDCGQPIKSPLESCVRTRTENGRKVPVPGQFHAKCPKPDPYAAHEANPGSYKRANWMKEQDAKHAAMKAQTIADFGRNDLDRPLPPIRGIPVRDRGALICTRHLATPKRHGDGHPPSWPSAEDWEP